MISAGRTGLLSIICVAFKELKILFLGPPAPTTGARLKFDIVASFALSSIVLLASGMEGYRVFILYQLRGSLCVACWMDL